MAKDKELEEIAPGILKKNDKTFFIVCKVSGKQCYCNAERLEKLASKYGGMDKIQDNYVSRDAKRLIKAKIKPEKIAKMDVDEVIGESQMIHKDKKVRKERRKKKQEEQEAQVEARRWKPGDEKFLPSFSAETIALKTQNRNLCLADKFWAAKHNCIECKYVNECKSERKVCILTIPKNKKKTVRDVIREHCKERDAKLGIGQQKKVEKGAKKAGRSKVKAV